MTREEIEQIIVQNIRTNGRGEITARVMAGVLQSFVEYTDTLSADFVRLCNAIADAFTVTVTEQEEKFEAAAAALEAKFEQDAAGLETRFEEFCRSLLEDSFEPWAEGLTNRYEATARELAANYAAALAASTASAEALAEQYEETADGVAEALEIIREGNQNVPDFVVPDGMKFAYSSITRFPDRFDFSQVTDGKNLFSFCPNLTKSPSVRVASDCNEMFRDCNSLADISGVFIEQKDESLGRQYASYAFANTSIEEVEDAQIVLSYGGSAGMFYNCALLRSAIIHFQIPPNEDIPQDVQNIEEIFQNCTSLQSARIDGLEVLLPSQYYYANRAFFGCESLDHFPLGDSLHNCASLYDSLPPHATVLSTFSFDATKLQTFIQQEPSDLEDIPEMLNFAPYSGNFNLQGCANVTLASMVNVITGLIDLTEIPDSRYFVVHTDVMARMQADTDTYEYNGVTYTGILALASAKGWTVIA